MKTLAQLAEKLEKLLDRLPEAIEKPVQREWRPIKELFINQRPPRILVIGIGPEAFLRELVAIHPGSEPVAAGIVEETSGPWRTFRQRGMLQFCIAEGLGEVAKSAILDSPPDLFLLVAGEELPDADLKLLGDLHHFDHERWNEEAPIVAAGSQTPSLANALYADAALKPSIAAVLSLAQREAVLPAIAKALPQEAQLEFARVTGEKAVQREIAAALSRSLTAVCTAIGTQPIPLADFPILTSLQLLLVGGIIHISGREWTLKTVRNFIAALGINIGAGLVFRESARAAVKLLPGWGNAISGAIAGAGTYAIGRAATAFFIEGLPIEEARRRFRLGKKKTPPEPSQLPG